LRFGGGGVRALVGAISVWLVRAARVDVQEAVPTTSVRMRR